MVPCYPLGSLAQFFIIHIAGGLLILFNFLVCFNLNPLNLVLFVIHSERRLLPCISSQTVFTLCSLSEMHTVLSIFPHDSSQIIPALILTIATCSTYPDVGYTWSCLEGSSWDLTCAKLRFPIPCNAVVIVLANCLLENPWELFPWMRQEPCGKSTAGRCTAVTISNLNQTSHRVSTGVKGSWEKAGAWREKGNFGHRFIQLLWILGNKVELMWSQFISWVRRFIPLCLVP